MASIITSNECQKCKFALLEEINKGKIYIQCSARDKKYHYGQIIECGDYEKKEEDK